MERRRSSIEVIADMLRLGEAGKTEIMYSANMSYFQLQKYLKFLLELKLIDRVMVGNPVVTYRVTRKGLKLLRNIDGILGDTRVQGKRQLLVTSNEGASLCLKKGC